MSTYSRFIYRLTVIAMCVAVITLSSWLSVPFTISFSMQTFAIFLISALFSPKISTSAVVFYLLLGIIGVPVFSGFNAGISALLMASGGALIAFPFCSLIISLFRKKYFENTFFYILLMLIALFICYTLSCLWYIFVFSPAKTTSIFSAITICVFPFIIPDVIKILLTCFVFKRIYPYIKRLPL